METSQSGMNDLLARLEAEGRFFETSTFTIDSLKAREKLSEFQLAESGLWLVKLVQSAVACGADNILIEFGKREVRVAFKNVLSWEADIVLGEVLSGKLSQDRPLLHLVTGLRASAASVNEQVAWSCGGVTIQLDSSGSSSQPSEDNEHIVIVATRPSRPRSLKRTLASSVYHLAKQTVEEYEAVKSRCWASPISIFLDGKKLERGYNLVKAGKIESNPVNVLMNYEKGRNRGVIACLGVMGIDAVRNRPQLSYPLEKSDLETPYSVAKPVYKYDTFLRWYGNSQTSASAVLTVLSDFRAESTLDYVCDGAMVKRFTLSELATQTHKVFGFSLPRGHDVAIRLTIPVELEQLDLSQFNLREPDVVGDLQRCLPDLKEMVKTLNRNRSQLWYIPISRPWFKIAGAGFGAQAAIMAAITKGLALIPITIAGGLGLTINVGVLRNQAFSGLKTLEERFTGYLARNPTVQAAQE